MPESPRPGPQISLIGGGWTPDARTEVYGPFLAAAGEGATVACVVFDEGDGAEQFQRWQNALLATARCRPIAVLVSPGTPFAVEALDGADALLVCGGLTPGYASVLAPAADRLREWLGARRPYAGFSAGAAIASAAALVGGWRIDGVPVCPADAGEDLDEVTVRPGLGLVPFSVDVHCAQWGTLSRAVGAVRSGRSSRVVTIDEDTALTVDASGAMTVRGTGAVHLITASSDGVNVSRFAGVGG